MLLTRRASLYDSKDIFDWRNDALSRQMSLTTDVVSWDVHAAWFAASLSNENRLLLICEDCDTQQKICIVRFDVENDEALISINLAPAMRGKGLAGPCLAESIAFFKNRFASNSIIHAEIKMQNLASKRIFERAGFVLERKVKDLLNYAYTT